MDPLDLLAQLGHVEPADPDVLQRAAARFLAASTAERDRAGSIVPPARPGLDAPGARSRWTRARIPRSRRLSWLAATTVATAAAVTGIALVVTPHPRPAGTSADSRPHAISLTGAILAAFDTHAGDIVEISKQVTGGGAADGLTQIWLSPAHPAPGQTQHYRRLTFGSDGKPTNDVEYTYAAPASSTFVPAQDSCAMLSVPATRDQDPLGGPGGFAHSQVTWVYYPLKQWWTASAVTSTAWFAGSAQVRACLAAGVWQLAGTGELDGQRAVRILQPGGNETYWLSASTYLPMQMVAVTPGGETITLRFGFLSPTTANLARVTLAVPPGFAKEAGSP
jgi:hypothetical protein